jgi:tRNA A-37 threonylcarbamoyl transferase component Bud32
MVGQFLRWFGNGARIEPVGPETYIVLRKEKLHIEPGAIKRSQGLGWASKATLSWAPYSVLPCFVLLNLIFLYVLIVISGAAFGSYTVGGLYSAAALCCMLVIAAVLTALTSLLMSILYINPIRAMGMVAELPTMLKYDDIGFTLCSPSYAQGLLIRWDSIVSLDLKECLYQGIIEADVLKITLDEPPNRDALQKHAAWFSFKGLRSPEIYLDRKTGKIPSNSHDPEVWLPLAIFGSVKDREKFLGKLGDVLGLDVLPPQLAQPDVNATAASFTRLWLYELERYRGPQRVCANGTELKQGAYKLLDTFGTGGFAVVYRALHTPADGAQPYEVALKEFIINSAAGSSSREVSLNQILNEADILERLDHPAIVKFVECFAEKGRVYLVLESVEGLNLRDYVQKKHPLAEGQILDIAIQCASILSYLHSLTPPVHHRDLSPDNFIVSGSDVKLVDFNVATESKEVQHSAVGKHCFMAPEQFAGQHTASSDLYQMGATLYFLATSQDPEPLSCSNPQKMRNDLSSQLCEIVSKLTAFKSGDRYANADELCSALNLARGPLSAASHSSKEL